MWRCRADRSGRLPWGRPPRDGRPLEPGGLLRPSLRADRGSRVVMPGRGCAGCVGCGKPGRKGAAGRGGRQGSGGRRELMGRKEHAALVRKVPDGREGPVHLPGRGRPRWRRGKRPFRAVSSITNPDWEAAIPRQAACGLSDVRPSARGDVRPRPADLRRAVGWRHGGTAESSASHGASAAVSAPR